MLEEYGLGVCVLAMTQVLLALSLPGTLQLALALRGRLRQRRNPPPFFHFFQPLLLPKASRNTNKIKAEILFYFSR